MRRHHDPGAKHMANKTVIWLEDSREQVVDQIIFCENVGLHVKLTSDLAEFALYLRPFTEEDTFVCLIIVDIMIYGYKDLQDLGIDQDTRGGYETGWQVIKHFLRPENGGPFSKLPIIIMSSRPLIPQERRRIREFNERSRKRDEPELKYIEKGGLSADMSMHYKTAFRTYVRQWMEGKW